MSARRRHLGQREQLETNRFKHPLFAALSIITLLNAGAEIDLVPGDPIGLTVIIARLERMALVEIELPHVLPHRVAPDAAAGAEADMVIDLAIEDKRAGVFVFLASSLFPPGGILNRSGFADKVIRLHRSHNARSEAH